MPYFPPAYVFPSSGDRWRIVTDFTSGGLTGAGAGDWISSVSGTGANISAVVPWAGNVVGASKIELGTTQTGRAAWWTGSASLKLGNGPARFFAHVYYNTLSDGTNTYSSRIGFIDSSSAESTDGVFFRYTHGTNSGKFQCVTISNTSETAADSGITVTAANAYRLMIEVNADASSAVFSINGSVVHTATLTIPGSTRELGLGIMALRSAGTDALNPIYADFLEGDVIFTSTRW